jgi:hypothetical protein
MANLEDNSLGRDLPAARDKLLFSPPGTEGEIGAANQRYRRKTHACYRAGHPDAGKRRTGG